MLPDLEKRLLLLPLLLREAGKQLAQWLQSVCRPLRGLAHAHRGQVENLDARLADHCHPAHRHIVERERRLLQAMLDGGKGARGGARDQMACVRARVGGEGAGGRVGGGGVPQRQECGGRVAIDPRSPAATERPPPSCAAARP